MKKYEGIWRNYEGYMKKYEGNNEGIMKKYKEINKKIRTLPIYGPWDLKKFWAHPLISGWGGGGSQLPGLGVPQRKDMKHVNWKMGESYYVH